METKREEMMKIHRCNLSSAEATNFHCQILQLLGD